MRKFVLALVLAGMCLGLTGCIFFDPAHNRRHIKNWRADIREMHADMDFVLGWQSESPLIEDHNR